MYNNMILKSVYLILIFNKLNFYLDLDNGKFFKVIGGYLLIVKVRRKFVCKFGDIGRYF